MLNAKDVSGMYSKTGRVLYEKMHILRRKDEILNPQASHKLLRSADQEMDELVGPAQQELHFTEKIRSLRTKEDALKPLHKLPAEDRAALARRHAPRPRLQPFDKMESRFHFFSQKVPPR